MSDQITSRNRQPKHTAEAREWTVRMIAELANKLGQNYNHETTLTLSTATSSRKRPVLAVDLDGTLLRSDMLFESFWSAFKCRWWSTLVALLSVVQGRAALKKKLSTLAHIDPTLLPYNEEVIDYVRAWRDDGGRTLLISASDQGVLEKINSHLILFDDVQGSDGSRNLKGNVKAAALVEQYGQSGYIYMGDSPTDIPVWKSAEKAITVNASKSLQSKTRKINSQTEHIVTHKSKLKDYLRAIRPHQWLKNCLVFVPILAAHQLSLITLQQSILAFAAFSVVASSVYVLNDLLDLEADRAHPRKHLRPFASGRVPLLHATPIAPLLLVLGFALAVYLGPLFLLTMLGYYATTVAYSFVLKRIVLVDVFVLAGLYTFRIVAGGAATGIPLSVWLIAFSIFFFLSLAAVKRQAELTDSAARGVNKPSGRGYVASDLPFVTQMATAAGYVSVLVFALYLNSANVAELYSQPMALWGICLILLYWITRVTLLAHRGLMHDDPVVFAVKDRISQICGLIVAGLAVAGALL